MKVFISASKRETAAALASHVELMGYEIVSSWINDGSGLIDDDEVRRAFTDIDECDVYIVINDLNTNGKYIEFGYAYAKRKGLIVYGKPLARAHKFAEVCDNLKQLNKALRIFKKELTTQ